MDVITGGLGFIGNELVRQLAARGPVTILDNRNRVAPALADLAAVPVREVDLTDHDAVRRALLEVRPRVVYHLAAIHFIPECNASPERTLRVNVEATMGLLRGATAAGAEHFVFASSGAVYADCPNPLDERAAIGPVDIYGWSKWFAEDLCRWHAAGHGLPVTLCRLFNNYGPRETNAHIIPEILDQLRRGDQLQLGNVEPRRDYIHTRDTAEALRRLGARRPAGVEIVNVASGHHASVRELVELLSQLLGRRIELQIDPARFRKADKAIQVADIRRLEALTQWRPAIGLREGLADLLRFEGLSPGLSA